MTDELTALLKMWSTGLVFDDALANKMLQLAPPDTFTALPNARQLGVSDCKQFRLNLNELHMRHADAMRLECWVEVITLRMQHIELWLRMWWVLRFKFELHHLARFFSRLPGLDIAFLRSLVAQSLPRS